MRARPAAGPNAHRRAARPDAGAGRDRHAVGGRPAQHPAALRGRAGPQLPARGGVGAAAGRRGARGAGAGPDRPRAARARGDARGSRSPGWRRRPGRWPGRDPRSVRLVRSRVASQARTRRLAAMPGTRRARATLARSLREARRDNLALTARQEVRRREARARTRDETRDSLIVAGVAGGLALLGAMVLDRRAAGLDQAAPRRPGRRDPAVRVGPPRRARRAPAGPRRSATSAPPSIGWPSSWRPRATGSRRSASGWR